MITDVQIKLAALWVVLMLTYLLGDVMRIFSGDFKAGDIGGMEVSQGMYFGLAIIMVIPIVMVFLTLVLPDGVNRWLNIIIPILFFAFNAIGLPTYTSSYDRFLIVVGLIWNVVSVYMAWTWG